MVRYPLAADEDVTQERAVQDVGVDSTRALHCRPNGVNGFEKPTLDGGVDQRYRMVQVC